MDGESDTSEAQQRDSEILRRAWISSQLAPPISNTLEPLSDEELARPIEDNLDEVSELPQVTIPGYSDLTETAMGGQATVYRAIQQSTGRFVAIKVVHGGPLLSSRHRARFEREVSALARLDHPNIVSIIDRGRSGDGSFFLVMKFIDGQPLDLFVRSLWRSGGSVRTVLQLFAEICDAVQEAHRLGIVHRDLKPSNLRVDEMGRPHILDFGLAMMADSDSDLTQTGGVVGSVRWASPEQVFAERQAVGPWSDVYSLGVMLYLALVERMPHGQATTVAEMQRSINSTRIIPPSRLDRGRGIDSALDTLVMRSLSRSRSERFPNAGAFAQAIRQYVPTAKRSPWIKRSAILTCVILALLGAQLITRPPQYAAIPARPSPPVHIFLAAAGIPFVALPSLDLVIGGAPSRTSTGKLQHLNVDSLVIQTAPVSWEQWRSVMKTNDGGPAQDPAIVTREDALRFSQRLSKLDNCDYQLPDPGDIDVLKRITHESGIAWALARPIIFPRGGEWYGTSLFDTAGLAPDKVEHRNEKRAAFRLEQVQKKENQITS